MKKILIIVLILFAFNLISKELSLEGRKEIFKKADKIMLQISKYGKRKPNLTVKKSLTSKKEIIAYLESELKAQYKGKQFLAEEQVLKLMGLINEKVDYKKAIKDVISKEVAGYYNPKNNTMYIADWIDVDMQEPVLAHELFHAVQRENYDAMDKMMSNGKINSDESLAISSLMEGEATAIMMDYEMVIKNKRDLPFDKVPMLEFILNLSVKLAPSKSFDNYSNYPQVMMSMMIFPYVKGLLFLKHFKKEGGWEAIDKIYKRLPISTEQILHVDKYLKNEKPIKIKLKNKKKLISSCKYIGESVFGEAFFYNIFKNDNINRTTVNAAKGWNGDKIFIYKCKDRFSGILISEWDSKLDAKEFLNDIKLFLIESKKGELANNSEKGFYIVKEDDKNFAGVIQDEKVIILLNFEKDSINNIRGIY